MRYSLFFWAWLFFLNGSLEVHALTQLGLDPNKESDRPRMGFRGYTQFRYNQLGVTNPDLVHDQGDRSIGGTNNFFIRRGRLVIFGNPSERTYVYIQPDLASAPGGSSSTHFLQLRDLYLDLFLDQEKTFRLRFGQSKIPYGFENLQSSQNRLPLDRNDALNSAVKDERDIGIFFYWASQEIRKRFDILVDKGLKGSGDYGVFALGGYNGQFSNQQESNRGMYVVSRLTYPFLFGEQFVEMSIQGYSGRFVPMRAEGVAGTEDVLDQRMAVSFILYPQPFGLQAEYNEGVGPQYDPLHNLIDAQDIKGGYVLLSYRQGGWIPFVRQQSYRGGRKHMLNTIYYRVDETEIGVEWQIEKAVELTTMYVISERTNPQNPNELEEGQMVRMQLQWNY